MQGPLSIHTRMPMIDGVHCVYYDVESDGENFISTNVCEKLRGSLEDPERSYRIYEAGYDWAMTHLTEKATASYVIETCEKHYWGQPTKIQTGIHAGLPQASS